MQRKTILSFLYVLSLYARDNVSQKAAWKSSIRERFRREIQEWLQKDYDFYAMRAKPSVDDAAYIKTHFQQVLGKMYAPFAQDKHIYSLALDNADQYKAENDALITELRQHFFVEPCALGRNPLEVLPEVSAVGTGIMPPDADEKNVLTCLVRKTDDNFKNYFEHNGKSYTMERIPTINLMGIKYLLPMVGGMIDGYYEIDRMAFVDNKGVPGLRLRLGEYHHIGDKWVHIYRTKMQPGELISLDYTMKMYNE